ncbi:MAG: peptide-methionine (S)-S-oxide reductase, partial [Acidobacteria bacterium]|nr:peptide-methionine (S)-S-oxide reductase [Acidobacteriota bacterium]
MKKSLLLIALFALVCAAPSFAQNAAKKQPAPAVKPKVEVATFAGGCFWCMQPPFDYAKGVV